MRLPDQQVLTAELPNDELGSLGVGSTVFVDLRRAKAFRLSGSEEVTSEPVEALAE